MLPDTLLETLQNLPENSGVYHYFDAHSKLLYIGKAKNLKKRVRSYFQFTPALAPSPKLSPRIHKMISEAAFIRYIIVESEHDALVLENSLIKQLKPKYNILLRDDKTFPYIYYDELAPFPRLELTRQILARAGVKYFGPYTTGAREVLDSLYELLPLVQKSACLRGKQKCLFFQIERCKAPCEGRITKEAYQEIFQEALGLLNHPPRLIQRLKERMGFLAEQLRFEEAGELRDRIEKLARLETHSEIDLARLEDLDIIALEGSGKSFMLVRLFMRQGRIVSSASTPLRAEQGIDEAEVYRQAILGHYSAETPLPPRQILLPLELENREELEAHLQRLWGRKTPLHAPKQGSKKALVELARKNARELLRLESEKEEVGLLESLQALLGLEVLPRRIEAFDTSHMRGEACVGAMVVYEEGFCKESYRHYALEGSDEYSQMREMLRRRAEAFGKESPPDLWLLDGGRGQINLAREILDSLGVNLEVVAIAKEKLDSKAHRAKGSAHDIIRSETQEWRLLPSDKRLQLLQRIRDEVHRFAITYHRQKKRKQDKSVKLLEVKGIAQGKLKRLLDFFGSFEAIERASVEELSAVVSLKEAKAIVEARGK